MSRCTKQKSLLSQRFFGAWQF